jgi:hypothetical protein
MDFSEVGGIPNELVISVRGDRAKVSAADVADTLRSQIEITAQKVA